MTRYEWVLVRKAENFPITAACGVAEVSIQAFNDWRRRRESDPTPAELEQAALVEAMWEIDDEFDGVYGSPRMTVELQNQGWVVNHKRVERLMALHGIVGVHKPAKVRTTIPAEEHPPLPDLVGRGFKPGAADVAWVGDITYIPTGAGWLYLTIARSQQQLMEQLVQGGDGATVLSSGKADIMVADGIVKVDVMDLADDPLPTDESRRVFALARRDALVSAASAQIVISEPGGAVVIDTVLPVATLAALVAMRVVAVVGRSGGRSAHKIGSDIHDLVRSTGAAGAQSIGADLAGAEEEVTEWIETRVRRLCGADLRYSLSRLRATDRSAGAQALTDDNVAATAILADARR